MEIQINTLSTRLKGSGVIFNDIKTRKISYDSTPSSITFTEKDKITLCVDEKVIRGNHFDEVIISDLRSSSAVALRSEPAAYNLSLLDLKLLNGDFVLSFLFDVNSGYFMLSDPTIEHRTLFMGFFMLKDFGLINTYPNNTIKGILAITPEYKISSALTALFAPTFKVDILKDTYYRFGLGLKTLGVTEEIKLSPFPTTFPDLDCFLQNNGIYSLGSLLEKFAP